MINDLSNRALCWYKLSLKFKEKNNQEAHEYCTNRYKTIEGKIYSEMFVRFSKFKRLHYQDGDSQEVIKDIIADSINDYLSIYKLKNINSYSGFAYSILKNKLTDNIRKKYKHKEHIDSKNVEFESSSNEEKINMQSTTNVGIAGNIEKMVDIFKNIINRKIKVPKIPYTDEDWLIFSISKLNERCKKVLYFFIQGYKYKDIKKFLEIDGDIWVIASRCRSNWKNILKKGGYFNDLH